MSTKSRVLIVEDNDDVRETVLEILRLEGHEVHFAVNGLHALEKLMNIPVPDLIILDIMMPVMDGPTFYTHLKKLDTHSDVPVVLFSAIHDINTIKGVNGHLKKPADLKDILSAVTTYSRKK